MNVRFGARKDGVEVVRDSRVEHLALVQREGEIVEERVGDEEVDRVALLLACDQLFTDAALIFSHLIDVCPSLGGVEQRNIKGRTERM